jgi:branched-chain amino acid transport system substrate-binding protein
LDEHAFLAAQAIRSSSERVAMHIARRNFFKLYAAAAAMPAAAHAQPKQPTRIGVLGDMNGPYADFAGPGAVIAAGLAAEEVNAGTKFPSVEILSADHQNKPDLAVSIARSWIDIQGVDAIVECATSGSALALQPLMREKERILLLSVSGSSDITNKACSPFGFHFNCDTFALARSTGGALTKSGADTWFFITVDYAFGHALERDTTRFVNEAGGKVLGSVRHPLNTADFSSYLLAARASGAKVVAFANAGTDAQNVIKQASEFGLQRSGQRLAALLLFITDVVALGLTTTQDLVLSTSFYWDLNDSTRGWTKRFRQHKDRVPTMNQAAVYAAVRHYIRASQNTGRDAKLIATAMRALPVNDMYNDTVRIRDDGRVLSKMYLMQVKSPTASAYADDVYKMLSTTPGEEAFRPLTESQCNLIRT